MKYIIEDTCGDEVAVVHHQEDLVELHLGGDLAILTVPQTLDLLCALQQTLKAIHVLPKSPSPHTKDLR